MKRVLNIFLIIILFIAILYTVKYVVYANIAEEDSDELSNEEILEQSNQNVLTKNEEQDESTSEIDIKNLVTREEKYLNVYKTSNGEEYTIIGELKIDKININYNILSSTSPALLKVSLNKYWGPEINEVGNFCIVGHNYLDSRFFGRLNELRKGDIIEITDTYGGKVNYKVYNIYIADPYDTSCTSQITNGNKEITLITCYNHGTQRLVVKAREVINEKNTNIIQEIINKVFNNN